MSKEKLYKTFFSMGMAFLKLSFAAWLDKEKAKEKLKEVRFFIALEKIVQHGKSKFKEGGFVPPHIDEHESVILPDKTSRFKERLEQALTEQDEATKKRIQQALKGSKPPIPPCTNKCKCRN